MRPLISLVAMVTAAAAFAGATVASAPLSALFISFLLYGFIGWLWESTVCAMLNHGHFANSGFLLGPCCPIYGVGGLACWLCLRGIEGLPEQFVAAAIVCSIVEYTVGVLLERATNARFWDYTNLPFNINGRVCLYGALMFGAGAVLICRIAEPAFLAVLAALPVWLVRLVAFALAVLAAVDTVASLASWRSLSEKLEAVRADLADRIDESLRETSDAMLEKVPAAATAKANTAHVRGRAINGWLSEISDAVMDALREKVAMPQFIADGSRGLHMAAGKVRATLPGTSPRRARPVPKITFSRRDLRFFNAFPHLRMNRYEGVIRATDLRARARKLFRR